jgi:hypothetical protein
MPEPPPLGAHRKGQCPMIAGSKTLDYRPNICMDLRAKYYKTRYKTAKGGRKIRCDINH